MYRILAPAGAFLVAAIALLVALAFGGGAQEQALGDPGPVVRWGLPFAKLMVNISAATMIGALALALWAFTSREKAYFRSIDVAAGAALLLTHS